MAAKQYSAVIRTSGRGMYYVRGFIKQTRPRPVLVDGGTASSPGVGAIDGGLA